MFVTFGFAADEDITIWALCTSVYVFVWKRVKLLER